MKRITLILLAVVSLITANTSRAAIEWTADQCVQNWGKPTTSTIEGGLTAMSFLYQNFSISVQLENDKVISVIYLKAGITDQDLDTIRVANGKDWKFLTEQDGRKYWTANDLICISSGTQKLLGTIDSVMVFYRRDLQRLAKIRGVQ